MWTVNGAVNVNDPKDLGVIVLVLIQAIKFIGLGEVGGHGKEAPDVPLQLAAQIRAFQNRWHNSTKICSTSRVGARVLDEVMALR